jgi:SAM-dependent methyltransferase
MDAHERGRATRQEWESETRAAHYARGRWTRSRRARRTAACEERIVRDLLADCGPLADALDVPCGTGRFQDVLRTAPGAPRLVSVDASLAMLGEHPDGERLAASVAALPFRAVAFDAVLCARLLHHFKTSAQRTAVMAELARVSRRWVVASYYDMRSWQALRNGVRRRFRGRWPVPRAVFEADALQAGLTVRARVPLLRGISEQVWVLLEKGDRR